MLRLFRRVPLLGWIFGTIAAAALIAWPLGGWDTVKVVSKVLPDFAAGDTFHGHRYDVQVGDVFLTRQSPAGFSDADDGEIFLVARVEVTNVWHESSLVVEFENANLVLEDGKYDAEGGPSAVFAADGTRSPELNPGMPREIELFWTISDAAVRPGDTVHFTLYDSIPRAGFILYGTSWVDLFAAGTAERVVTS